MNTKYSSFLVVVATAVALASTSSGVEAAAYSSGTVECLPESSTDICVGEASFYTPSPAVACDDPTDPNNCTTLYLGGYSWKYEFVQGLENGTDIYNLDPDVAAKAKTGLVVTVTIDDDSACSIDVGNNETCKACSDANCGGNATAISFDCTNVPNGRASAICEPLPYNEGGLYPLLFPSNEQMLQEDNESTLDDNSSDGIDRHLEEGTGPVLTPAADTGTTYGSSSSGGNSGTDTCPVKITLDSEGGPMGNGRCFGVGAGCAYKKNYRKYAQCNCVQQGRKRPKWQCFPDPSIDDSDMLKD